MARKKVVRALPRLPRSPAWRRGDNKIGLLLEILSRVAIKNQKGEAHAFYSLREVQRHFRVPISMVAEIYSRLEKNGILNRVRGSKTLLQGSGSARQISMHGLVGLPVSVSSLIRFQDYRTFVVQAKDELRARGFVTEIIYFENRDLQTEKLNERFKRYAVDTVVWFRPELSTRETIARLRDRGIQTLGISDGGLPGTRCRYQVRRDAARLQILRSWRLSGEVERVVVVSLRNERSTGDGERLSALLEEDGWEFEMVGLSTRRPEVPAQLLRKGSGIFLQSSAASILAFRVPERLMELMQTHRVALVDGPVSIPFGRFPGSVRADLVHVEWRLVAREIARDLMLSGKILARAATSFEAEAHIRESVSSFAQTL